MKSLSTLIIVAALTWAMSALAEGNEQSKSVKAQAAEAFEKGQTLYEKGEYLEAAAAFERAYSLAPHPSVLANIGYCYDEFGDYPRAVSAFRKYLKQPNPDTPQKNAKIAKFLKRLESKVGDLRVDCSPSRCEVNVDKISRGLTPLAMVLQAGAHSVNLVPASGGGKHRSYNVRVPKGGAIVLDVDLTLAPSPTPVYIKAEEDSEPRLRAPFWIATAATIVGGGTIAVIGGLNYKVREDFKKGGSLDTDLKEKGENLTIGTNIAIGVTAALATTAIVLAIIDLTRSPDANGKSQESAKLSKPIDLQLFGGAFTGIRVAF